MDGDADVPKQGSRFKELHVFFVGTASICAKQGREKRQSEQSGREKESQKSKMEHYVHDFLDQNLCMPRTKNAVYFASWCKDSIFKYNLGTQETSIIQSPTGDVHGSIALMTMDDGRLGFANVVNRRLYLWSKEADPGAGWSLKRAIELDPLLPVGVRSVATFADGVRLLFLWTVDDGLFAMDVKSGNFTKVLQVRGFPLLFPYMSFYTPTLFGAGSTGEEPTAGVLNASQT